MPISFAAGSFTNGIGVDTMYAMVSSKAQARFRAELAAGRRPRLTRDDFDPPPPRGAFDTLPKRLRKTARDQQQELPSHTARQLDALGDDSARQVHAHLAKRFARDLDPDEEDDGKADIGVGDLETELCDLLSGAGVSPEIVQRVHDMFAANGGDGTLRLTHGDQGSAGGPSSGYDPTGESPGFGQDQPAPFRGAPQAPYTSSGDAERRAALGMSRIKSLTPGDLVYKDGTPFTGTTPNGDQYLHGARLRRPARDAHTHERGHRFTGAMDAASAEGFFTRFPDARRIRSL
jgi:hypothetical protein